MTQHTHPRDVEHTPGPWSWETGFIRDEYGTFVAVLARDEARCEADTRLLATAPAMLNELRLAAQQFRSYEQQHRAKTQRGQQFDVPGPAQDAALAKAETNRLIAERIEALIAEATGIPS